VNEEWVNSGSNLLFPVIFRVGFLVILSIWVGLKWNKTPKIKIMKYIKL